jgi:hypothetical protein
MEDWLKYVKPDHPWNFFTGKSLPHSFLNDGKNRKELVDAIGKELNVMKLEDWYNVTCIQTHARGCAYHSLTFPSSSCLRSLPF